MSDPVNRPGSYVTTYQPVSQQLQQKQQLQLPSLNKPLHPRFADLQVRIDSFNDPLWPKSCPVGPKELADAGFYYYGSFEGINDSVKCFCCDAGLCLWEKGDVAWTEHKRVSPNCPYVTAYHPDVVRQRELEEKRRQEEAARDPNEVVDDWMKGLMVQECLKDKLISRTQMRNILHQRWLQERAPFTRIEELQEAIRTVAQRLNCDKTSTRPVENGLRALNLNAVRDKLELHQQQLRESENTTLNRNANTADEDCGFASCDSDMSLPSSQESVSSNESSPLSSLSSDDGVSDNRLLCKVCMDKKLEVVFIPCGHFVSCSSCAQSLTKCPYCRKVISSALKTYLS